MYYVCSLDLNVIYRQVLCKEGNNLHNRHLFRTKIQNLP